MKHLSDDQLLCLASRINRQETLSYREELHVAHIGRCDACYEQLRCMMALLEVTDHADVVLKGEPKPAVENQAEIRLVIVNPVAILEQLYSQQAQWVFDAPPPFAFAGTRSGEDAASDVVKLEDIDNSRTYVAYQPSEKTLVIRLDCQPGEPTPRVWLRRADGYTREIEMVREGRTCWAKISGLEPGEYHIILKKS